MKVYRAKNDFELSLSIMVNGHSVNCVFDGGFKNDVMRRNGDFITADEELQKALEEDSKFGVFYELVYDSNKNEKKKKIEHNKGDIEPIYEILKATTKQKAIAELKSLFSDLEIEKTIKNNELEALANNKGYTFPNLQTN